MRTLRFNYGTDPTGQGFYWAASEQKRGEWLNVKRTEPLVAETVYQCHPGFRQGVIFTDDDFSFFAPPMGLEMGVGNPNVKKWIDLNGGLVVQAWDTAFSANASSDYTVCATALLIPCEHYHRQEDPTDIGPCEPHYDVKILDVYRERIAWAEVVPAARSQFMKWLPTIVVIEKRAYGVPLIENLTKAGVPLEAVNPTENKRARAVEGVGAGSVQGWFRLHRVSFASDADWLDEYVREFRDFTGEKSNRDDQVDATINLVQHAIKAGGSSVLLPTGWATPEAVDMQMGAASDPLGRALPQAIFEPDDFDPFAMTCGRCRHYVATARKEGIDTKAMDKLPLDFCTYHKTRLPIIASCDQFSNSDELITLSRW